MIPCHLCKQMGHWKENVSGSETNTNTGKILGAKRLQILTQKSSLLPGEKKEFQNN